jgi:hypothetical protein
VLHVRYASLQQGAIRYAQDLALFSDVKGWPAELGRGRDKNPDQRPQMSHAAHLLGATAAFPPACMTRLTAAIISGPRRTVSSLERQNPRELTT